MRDFGMPDLDCNGGHSFSDVAYPVVSGKNGDGFVESLCRYVERVRCLIQIVDNDGAGSKRYACNLTYSPIVRPVIPSRRYVANVEQEKADGIALCLRVL